MEKVRELAERFISELMVAFKEASEETARQRLAALVEEMTPARKPVTEKAEKPSRKVGIPSRRVCPIDGCTELGAPRFHQLCQAHRGVPEEVWKAAVEKAKAPGGKWNIQQKVKQAG